MCKYIFTAIFLMTPLVALCAENIWPPGSAMAVGLKRNDYYSSILSNIKKINAETMSLVEENAGAHISRPLINFNSVWVEYVTAACSAARETFGGASTWKSAREGTCRVNLASRRLHVLGNANACVKRHIRNQTKHEIPQCFYQTLTVQF